MSLEITIRLLSGLLLLLANAFFVATEFALTRLRQFSEEEIKGSKGLERAWKMTEKLEIYLTSCQIGITSTSILLGVIAEPGVTVLLESLFPMETLAGFTTHSISIVLSVILINFAHTVWGEQTPTYLGVEKAKSVARYFATPLYLWTYAIYPLLSLGDWITKATLKLVGIEMQRSWTQQKDEASSEGNIKDTIVDLLRKEDVSEDRREEVVKALEIDEIEVSEIMIERNDIKSLKLNNSLKQNMEIIKNSLHSRYPLVDGSVDELKGVLYVTEILVNIDGLQNGDISIEDIGHDHQNVSPDIPVSELIDFFQEQNQELALVEKDHKVVGLVTLTDALEVIVGSAEDPLDLKFH